MKRLSLLFLLILLFVSRAFAINCSDTATVQAAIDASGSGDTITCDTGGWSGSVTIGANDGPLTLDGKGVTVTGTLAVNASRSGTQRVTNFTFSRSGADTIRATSNIGDQPYRIDHITVTGSAHFEIETFGLGGGLWDNNEFRGRGGATEYFHINGTVAESAAGWTDAITPGQAALVYFEDNYFNGSSSDNWFDSYYGARWVTRFNTFQNWNVEAHGNVFASGRWWEVYHNNFTNSGSVRMCFRGGSGIIFNNIGNISSSFVEEANNCSAGQNQCDAIGKGQNYVQWPMYWWGNASASPRLNQTGCAPAISGAIVLNQDVFNIDGQSGASLPSTCTTGQGFWKTDEGGNWNTLNSTSQDGTLYKCTSTNTWTQYYTPYTYPHPLRLGTIITQLTPPVNLRVAQ